MRKGMLHMISGLLTVIVVAAALVMIALLFTIVTAPKTEPDIRGVRIVGIASLLVAVIIAVTALWQAVTLLIPGSPVTMTVPISPLAITPSPGVTPAPSMTHFDVATYDEATVTSSEFSAGVRIPSALGTLLVAAVPVMIGVAIWIACRRLLAGTPFAASVVRISLASAVVSLVAGFVGQILLGTSVSAASVDLFSFSGSIAYLGSDAVPGPGMTGLPESTFSVNVEFWPIAVAFILAVFATIVQFGSRVQAQRDELAVETDELRRDTEGLV